MTAAALSALLSHWMRRPFQLVTLIVGLALATALWSGVQAINAEARSSYDRAAGAVGGGGLDDLVASDGGGISVATYVALRRAGWQVSPIVEGWIAAEGGRVRLLGLDPLTAPPQTAAATEALSDDPGAFFATGSQILAAPETARRLSRPDLPDVEAVAGLAPGLAFADIAVAQELLEQPDRLSRLVVLPDQPKSRPPLAEIAPGLERRTPAMQGDLARLTDSFHLNLTAFGLLSFAVGLFIVHGAVGLAFEQRRPVFRTLRALGLSARRLVAIVALELLVFALIAGLIGVVLGYLISAALLPDVAATLRGLYGATVEGTLTLELWWWAAGLVIAVAGTAVASASSLVKLARLPALAPAQPRAWARASAGMRRLQLLASLGLAAAAAVLALAADGLVAGFAMLGALLVAAALALPPVLDVALRMCARFGGDGPRAEWFWADTRQQLPGLSLALMALLLALAANIGVGTMVSSFRATFVGWLDQRLASELYVTAGDEQDAAPLVAFLEPRVDAILPIWNFDGTVLGQPAEIFGVADHATYRDNWPLLSRGAAVWDRVAAGDAVLINEQLARREAMGVGDPIVLPGGWETVVGGIYSDYGNPLAQVIVGLDELTRRYPGAERDDFGLRIAPDQVAELKRALTEEFGLPPENMIDQAALKAFSLDVFDRTFTVTGALNVLTLAIAGFAILTSLLTLSAMRLPQLAPVWALGLTRREIGRLEVLRAVLLAVLTFVLSVPVGLLLAWVLLAVINVDAFGWRIPMQVFPVDWLWLGALSLVAAGCASLWPARRLARMAPARLVAVFAHER